MKKILIVSVWVVAWLTLLPVANGTILGTVNIERNGFGAHGTLRIWGDGFSGQQVYGGIYMFNKNGDTGEGDYWPDGTKTMGGPCVELPQNSPSGWQTYDVCLPQDAPQPTTFLGDVMGPVKESYLRELWNLYFDPAWVGTGPFTSQQNSDAEAFQACMWEIVYEAVPSSPAGWDVTVDGTSGPLGFYCSEANTTQANEWLYSLQGSGQFASLRALVHDDYQDYLVEVPEPVTLALFGMGAAVLIRKRQ